MPSLFPMPFLARLTSDQHNAPEGPQEENADRHGSSNKHQNNKKRAHEPRPFDEARGNKKESKRPRLGTQILSSRPKIFANGLLSPVKSVATATSPTGPDRVPGRDPVPAKTASTTSRAAPGSRATKAAAKKEKDTQASSNTITSYFKRREPKIETRPVSASPPPVAVPAAAQQHVAQKTSRSGDQQQEQQSKQPPKQEDKRSLRSHDGGTRARSELAQYFPSWDEIVSDEPLPQDPITHKTRIQVVDEPPKAPSTPSRARQVILPAPPTPCTPSSPVAPLASPSGARGLFTASSGRAVTVQPSAANIAGPPPHQTFTRIDFSSHVAQLPREPAEDPLSEEHFRPAHQRGERQEKQLRNIEKEKAQHEKVQLERLYDGLLGSDWLRQMGISGVTDGEKRDKWEAKRDHVVTEVKAMLDKFDRYRDEEKRLKLEKEAHMREDEDEEEEEDEEDEDEEETEGEEEEGEAAGVTEIADSEGEDQKEAEHRKRRRRPTEKAREIKRLRRPSKSEEQATAAANQLINETLSSPAMMGFVGVAAAAGPPVPKHKRFTSISSRTGIDVTPQVQYAPAGVDAPFVSFFSKPHLRAAAIAGSRRGRVRFAFGQLVPELEEQEFSLPEEWLTKENRRDAARLRRMRRRGRKMEEE